MTRIALIAILFPIAVFAQKNPAQIEQTIATGNYVTAIQECEETLKTNPSRANRLETLHLLGLAQQYAGQENDAIRTWENLISEPGSPATWRMRAMISQADLWKENPKTEKNALTRYIAVINQWPRGELTPEAIVGAARILRRQGDLAGAIQQLEAWRREFNSHELADTAAKELAELKKIIAEKRGRKPPRTTAAQRKISEAENFKKEGKFSAAARAYSTASSLAGFGTPDYWQGRQEIVACWRNAGNYENALAEAKSLVSDKSIPPPLRAKILVIAGKIMLEGGEHLLIAESIFKQVIEEKSDKGAVSEAQQYLILALLRQKKLTEANALLAVGNTQPRDSDDFSKSRRLQNWAAKGEVPHDNVLGKQKSISPFCRIGDDFFAILDFPNAAKSYAEAKGKTTNLDEEAYCIFQEARSLAFCKKHQQALACYRQLTNNPKFKQSKWTAPALLRAGLLCIGPMNDEKEGLEFFSDLTKRYPQNQEAAEALYSEAQIHHWNKRWNKASTSYGKIIKLFPETSYAASAQRNLEKTKTKIK